MQGIEPFASPKQEDRVLAGACHLAMFVGFPIVGPLALYFVKKDSSRFVAFHALQATFLGVASIPLFVIGYAAGMIGAIAFAAAAEKTKNVAVMIGTPIAFLGGFGLPMLVVCGISLYAAYRGFTGSAWRIPLLGRLADKVLEAPVESKARP
jgi:uncharacterized Tic20 family protein